MPGSGDQEGTELTERMDERLGTLEKGIDRIWSQRREDRDLATTDNRTRHSELMGAIKEVNGDVRDHGESIAGIEARCEVNHPLQALGIVAPAADPGKRAPMDPARKLAMQTGASSAGAIGIIWALYHLIALVVQAVQGGAVP